MLGTLADLEEIIAREELDRVIVAFSQARHPESLQLVRLCADHGVKVNIVPRLFEVVSSRAGVDDIEGIPLLDVGHVELSRFNMAVKRAFDVLVGGVGVILVLPLFAVVAVLIKLDSPGPVFFRQERMGRGGCTFRMWKFRTMTDGAEHLRHELNEQNEYSGPMFKIKEDPRITRLGAWLRRMSIDELPQIFNVVRGEMSLVGPRPLWTEEAKQCRGWTQKRLDITPGITGLWQVTGRSDVPFDEMVKLDYLYVTGWSLGWDVKLLLQTVPAVLGQARGVLDSGETDVSVGTTARLRALCDSRSDILLSAARRRACRTARRRSGIDTERVCATGTVGEGQEGRGSDHSAVVRWRTPLLRLESRLRIGRSAAAIPRRPSHPDCVRTRPKGNSPLCHLEQQPCDPCGSLATGCHLFLHGRSRFLRRVEGGRGLRVRPMLWSVSRTE